MPCTPASRAAAAGFVDYRFDTYTADDGAPMQPVAPPHVFRRAERPEYRTRPLASRSSVLPDSNPFAIPTTSLIERISPALRFLALFLIFTAVGTFTLTKLGEQQARQRKPDDVRAVESSSHSQQKLEPATGQMLPMPSAPSARGPAGRVTSEALSPTSTTVEESSWNSEMFQPLSRLADPSSLRLTTAGGSPLPQVRTEELFTSPSASRAVESNPSTIVPQAARAADSAPAVARLPGIIREVPPQQAQHDNHQPGLY